MGEDMVRKLQRKCRIKLRVLREKPRFVLGYVMDALFTWVLGLTIAILGLVLFPALAPSGAVSGVKLPPLSEMVNVDKAGQVVSELIEKMRQFSWSGFMRFLKEDVPGDLKRLFVGLCELVKRWRELLEQFVALLLAPRKILERMHAFWERHKVKIKAVATKALGVAISFLLFRLLMYVGPYLDFPILTIWGVNAGFFVLQWCIALISPSIARNLRMKLGEVWMAKKKKKLHAAGETFIANVRDAMESNRKAAEDGYEYNVGRTDNEKEGQDSGGGLGAFGGAPSANGGGG